MEQKRIHIFLSGKVQGVFFRNSALCKAKALNLSGWVKNLNDGRVEILFEGNTDKVEEMIDWAKQGPLAARVDNIDIKHERYKGEFEKFEIL